MSSVSITFIVWVILIACGVYTDIKSTEYAWRGKTREAKHYNNISLVLYLSALFLVVLNLILITQEVLS